MIRDLFFANLEALTRRSPATAAAIHDLAPDGNWSVVQAATGADVLCAQGRTMESRRDPIAEAERAAQTCGEGPVVMAGLGTGYFAEAVRRRGVELAAIVVDGAAPLVAALHARDLRELLQAAPVVLCEQLDAVGLATLRARAPRIVVHGPGVASSDALGALVRGWPAIRVMARPPRVLVVGPVYGGSLEVARSSARAFTLAGAESRIFDAAEYASAYHALGALAVPAAGRVQLQEELARVLGDAVVALAREWRADLVFALAQAPLGERSLGHLRELGIVTAFWFVENGRVLPYWTRMAPHYDWFYAIQAGRFLDQLHAAGAARPRYLPVACDPERHVPVALSADERARYGADVSFAGAPYLNRRRLFLALTDLDLKLWGAGWTDPGLAPFASGGAFTTDEMTRIFAATRVNLNVHSAEHVARLDPQPDYVNPRTFELAACGAFQIVDRRDPLPDLFAAEEAVTFGSVPELRARIDYYLAHEDERLAVVGRARARAISEHTYERRVTSVMRDTLPPELVASAVVRPVSETLHEALGRMERESPTVGREESLLRIVHEVAAGWAQR